MELKITSAGEVKIDDVILVKKPATTYTSVSNINIDSGYNANPNALSSANPNDQFDEDVLAVLAAVQEKIEYFQNVLLAKGII